VSDDTRDANVHLSADVTDYRQNVQSAAADTDKLSSAVDSLAARLDGLGRRTSKKLTLFAAADFTMMAGMVAMTANLENQLSALAGQSAITGRSMGTMTSGIRQMTRDLPTARGEIIQTATAISKMGVTSARDITGLAETFTKTAAAAGESAIGIGSSMTTLSRQMGTLAGGANQMQKFTDSLLHVSAVAGVSAQSVADFSNSIAPIGRVAGMSQTQLLGMSAAFVQAGNDGYAAANTFNTMLADITRTTTQGGPGLGKYSALLGMTIKQFQSMPASDQVLGIFKAINDAGPKSIAILDSMGIDGIKAARAIQTMAAQSGGLEKLIQTATGSYGDNSTTTGSTAAMSGLVDQMGRFKNIAEDMGTSIGQGVITPLTGALNVLNNILGQAAKVTGVFSAGGALAGAGGLVTGGAGMIGTIASYAAIPATLNWLKNTKTVGAFREARQAGIANRLGLPVSMGHYVDRYANPLPGEEGHNPNVGNASRFERFAFQGGVGLGNQFGAPSTGVPMWQRAAGIPLRMITTGANLQREFYRESRMPGYTRGGGMDLINSLKKNVTANEVLTRSAYGTAKALAKLELTAAGSGVSAVGSAAGRGLKRLGSGAMDLLGGPAGVALMAGLGALQLKSMSDKQNQEMADRATTDQFYNQSAIYSSALGLATTNLQAFTGSLTTTASAAKTVAEALRRASQTAMGTPITNTNVNGITTAAQGAAYLRSLGSKDPQVIQSAAADVKSRLGDTEGQKALDMYQKNQSGGAADVATLAGAVANPSGAGGIHWWDTAAAQGPVPGTQSDQAAQLTVGGILADVAKAEPNGKKAQAQTQANDIRTAITTILGGNGTTSQKINGIDQIAKKFGFPEDWKNGDLTATSFEGLTASSPSMGRWMASQQNNNGVDWFSDPTKALTAAATSESNPTTNALNRAGYSPNNTPLAGVNTLTGLPSDPTAQGKATQYAYTQARGNAARKLAAARASIAKRMGLKATDPRVIAAAGTISDYQSQDLQNVAGIEGVDSGIYGGTLAASQSAQQLVGSDIALQGSHQTRIQRLGSARTRLDLATQANADPLNLDKDKYANMQQRKAEYQTQLASYTSYLNQMVQAQDQFKLQMDRSEHDYYQSRKWAQQDFQRQSSYSRKDFQTSMLRQSQDAAKTITNPMLRTQSQYTTDVGTLKQNLTEQTKMIRKQVSNLRKLKKLGLSQASINMLDLANPAMAQQVEELAQEMTKSDARQINGQVSQRQGASNSLTQSDLNQNYTRQVADFKKSVSRSITEYQTGMNRMATQHTQQVARAKQDLALMSKEYVDDFTTVFNKAQAIVKTNLGTTANLTMGELDAIKKAFPEFFTTLPTTGGASTTASTGDGHPGTRTSTGGASTTASTGDGHPGTRTSTTRTSTAAQRAAQSSVGVISNSVRIENMYVTAKNPADIAAAIADKARSNKLKGLLN
jgi:TP901 family phage tail tape measure protein